MSIRKYRAADRHACLDIFKSNAHLYFDATELEGLNAWLNGQDKAQLAYNNSEAEFYYVLEHQGHIIACGGFYIVKNKPMANMAWGMVDHKYHKQGFGKQLFQFRLDQIAASFPSHTVILDTSQHTYAFFQRQGFSVTKITPDGYGPGLDRYDMIK